MRTSRRVAVIAGSVLVGGLLVGGTAAVTFVVMHDTRQDISLADIADSDWSPDPVPIVYRGMRDETGTLCAGVEGCLEGFESEHVSYFKFDRRHHAAAFARANADAYQSDWIVLRFTDNELTEAQRLEARQRLDELAISE